MKLIFRPELQLAAMPANRFAKQRWQSLARTTSGNAEQKFVVTTTVSDRKHYSVLGVHWSVKIPECRLLLAQSLFYKACYKRQALMEKLTPSEIYASYLEIQKGVRPWSELLRQELFIDNMAFLNHHVIKAYALAVVLDDPYRLKASIVRFVSEQQNIPYNEAKLSLTQQLTEKYLSADAPTSELRLELLTIIQNRGAMA